MTPSPYHGQFSYVIHELDTEPVTTRYYTLGYPCPQICLTPSGEYMIESQRVDRTSDSLGLRKLLKGDIWEKDSDITRLIRDNEAVYLDKIICYPLSMSDSDRFLLLGENDDEEMRLLIAPREGRALEIRPLSLSFNEAKKRLEIECEKRQALKDEDTTGTGK